MKKLIAILAIAIVLVGAVFAAPINGNESLTLKTTVGQVRPNFKLYSGNAISDGTNETEILTELDLSEQNISWDFNIKQFGSVNAGGEVKTFSRYKGDITLNVAINKFEAVANQAVTGAQITAYEITTESVTEAAVVVADKLSLKSVTRAADKHSIAFVFTFMGQKLDNSDATNIAAFSAEWTKDEALPSDGSTVYKSDVTLTYTIQ